MKLAFGDYVLDGPKRELRRGSQIVAIEPQVFDVLVYLVQDHQRVVTKDDLIAAVWHGRIVSDSTLNSRIAAARRAIGDTGERQGLIRTYARKGFRFVGDVRMEGGAYANPALARPEGRSAEGLAGEQDVGWGGSPSLLVARFRNLSGDPGQDYFSDGITEDIIAALSRYRSLMVIAGESSLRLQPEDGEIRRVAAELGAQYIVEGSVRRVGQRVRVSARLHDSRDGRQIWAERYDRDLEDLFVLQDKITTTIAARIEPAIGAAERLRVGRRSAPALQAWDVFRLGTQHFYRPTAADNLEAQALFRRAIESDPQLAQAYGFLSYAIVLSMIYFEADPDETRLKEAVATGRKAVELDDQDGLLRFMYGRALLAHMDYGDALAELETAVELNPCLAVAYCGLGDSLTYEGRIAEAFPHFQRAIDLSPYDPLRWAFFAYRALAHIFARQFESAAEWATRATRVPNAPYWPFAHRVSALGHLGDGRELDAAVTELLERNPGFSCEQARKRLFYLKDPDQLEVYLEGLRRAGVPA